MVALGLQKVSLFKCFPISECPDDPQGILLQRGYDLAPPVQQHLSLSLTFLTSPLKLEAVFYKDNTNRTKKYYFQSPNNICCNTLYM